jgi:hypothetical protein
MKHVEGEWSGLRITPGGSILIDYGDGPSGFLNSAQAQVAVVRPGEPP